MTGVDDELAPPQRRTALVASVAVGVVMVALVAVLALGDGEEDEASPLIGRAAPVVQGGTLEEGDLFDLDELRGRWVLVNFFAQWCAPCKVEHPELVAFQEAHDEIGDVQVVSVAFQDDAEDIGAFFAENGGDWPVVVDGVGPIAVAWGVTGIPESFLVSPQGIVVHKITGGVTAADLESLLAQARGVEPSGAGAGS